MLEAFRDYVSNYDMSDDKILVKYYHSLRVMELNRKYAMMMNWSNEDIELATLIGLLHDFGRFEQLRIFNSFDDTTTIDHADYSVVQLFDNNEIIKFTDKVEDYEIIRFAIKNHNKLVIEDTDNERALMHAKLIRDSDKVDILYLLGKLGRFNNRVDDSKVSYNVLECFRNNKLVLKNDVVTNNDSIAISCSFAFDINFNVCLEDFQDNFNCFVKRIEVKGSMIEVCDLVTSFLNNLKANAV